MSWNGSKQFRFVIAAAAIGIIVLALVVLLQGCASISYKPETGEIRYTNWKKVYLKAERKPDGSESIEIDSNPEQAWRGFNEALKTGIDIGKAAAMGTP